MFTPSEEGRVRAWGMQLSYSIHEALDLIHAMKEQERRKRRREEGGREGKEEEKRKTD